MKATFWEQWKQFLNDPQKHEIKGMNDRRYKYNAGGILKVNSFSAIEILLAEVFSGFGSGETTKISFDHYKAMLGLLAMIRTIAQLFDRVSFDTFSKLKIHFLHVHGKWFE